MSLIGTFQDINILWKLYLIQSAILRACDFEIKGPCGLYFFRRNIMDLLYCACHPQDLKCFTDCSRELLASILIHVSAPLTPPENIKNLFALTRERLRIPRPPGTKNREEKTPIIVAPFFVSSHHQKPCLPVGGTSR